MPQHLARLDALPAFERVAQRCGAAFHEVVLLDDRDEAIARHGRRGGDTAWGRYGQDLVEPGAG